MRSIRNSDYLTFAYRTFAEFHEPLVIFGHSLGDSDKHILQAVGPHTERAVAISIQPGRAAKIKQKKARIVSLLPAADLYFFDSTTHPLGSEAVKVVGKWDF